MIINYKEKYIFLKLPKAAGTSTELFLRQFCNKDDLITPLNNNEEKLAKKLNILSCRNYTFYKFSLAIKLLTTGRIIKQINFYNHSTLTEISKRLKLDFKNFKKYCVIRNPYSFVISMFYWRLSEKKINIKSLKFSTIKKRFNFYINNKIMVDAVIKSAGSLNDKKIAAAVNKAGIANEAFYLKKQMFDENKKLSITNFIKFENLENEIKKKFVKNKKKYLPLKIFQLNNLKLTQKHRKILDIKMTKKIIYHFDFIFKIGGYSYEIPKKLLLKQK